VMATFDFETLKQDQVDFVLPRLDRDVALGIDPFLLFKSRYSHFRELHSTLLAVFNEGVKRFALRGEADARLIIDFPEVSEIGLGYGKDTKRGSGLGNLLNQLLIDTLTASADLLDRGVKHIEEMQLLSVGIGADRISDISGNILKQFLIDYTQQQSQIWKIPLSPNVPIHHILDLDDYHWFDGYFDLPTNQVGEPIVLVPRWIVRVLPWINFDDYTKTEFSIFLRAKATRAKLRTAREIDSTKREIVQISRMEISRIDRYVQLKEKSAPLALPAELGGAPAVVQSEGLSLINSLQKIELGRENAREYQVKMLEILNFLFEPELIDGKLEDPTIMGTERRDIVFVNDSEKTFFQYLRTRHSNFLVVFEAKNVQDVSSANFNQLATYLGDKMGYCGFMLIRNPISKAERLKAISIYNNMKRIIIVLDDENIVHMIQLRIGGKDPMRHLQKLYREFMVSVQ
jgi:hypothetical protein